MRTVRVVLCSFNQHKAPSYEFLNPAHFSASSRGWTTLNDGTLNKFRYELKRIGLQKFRTLYAMPKSELILQLRGSLGE